MYLQEVTCQHELKVVWKPTKRKLNTLKLPNDIHILYIEVTISQANINKRTIKMLRHESRGHLWEKKWKRLREQSLFLNAICGVNHANNAHTMSIKDMGKKTQRNPGPGSGEAMVPLYLNSYVEDIAKKRPKLDVSPRQLYLKTQLLRMPLPILWFHLGEGNPTSALLSSLGSSSSSNFNTLLRQFPLASKFGSAPLALFLCCWLTHVSQKFSTGSTLLHS